MACHGRAVRLVAHGVRHVCCVPCGLAGRGVGGGHHGHRRASADRSVSVHGQVEGRRCASTIVSMSMSMCISMCISIVHVYIDKPKADLSLRAHALWCRTICGYIPATPTLLVHRLPHNIRPSWQHHHRRRSRGSSWDTHCLQHRLQCETRSPTPGTAPHHAMPRHTTRCHAMPREVARTAFM